MKDALRAIDRGESVTVTYRGKEKARLAPIESKPGKELKPSDHPACGMWKDREDMKDPVAYIRKMRDTPAIVIFDSDVLVRFLRGEPAAIKLIDWTADRVVSIVTLMELQRGAQSKLEMKTTRELFQQRAAFKSIGHIAAGLIEEHSLSCGLGVHDALIAAAARDAGETLATANVRHFRPIANLDVKPFRPRSR